MADEVTPTQTSETTSTEATANDATALGGGVEAATETASTGEAGAEAADAETTALNSEPATEAADEAPVIPETYELTAPEGLTLDTAALEAATPVFKELGLTNEQANKLMPVAGQFAQSIADKLNAQIIGQVAADRRAWLDTAKADPEIGGAQWDTTLTTAAKALDTLGFTKGSPFRNLLDESGLGNHPEMIRAFRKVGEAISEDAFVRTDHGSASETNAARILYPNDKPKGA